MARYTGTGNTYILGLVNTMHVAEAVRFALHRFKLGLYGACLEETRIFEHDGHCDDYDCTCGSMVYAPSKCQCRHAL